eukprot:5867330-Prymnesium_polylepis.1
MRTRRTRPAPARPLPARLHEWVAVRRAMMTVSSLQGRPLPKWEHRSMLHRAKSAGWRRHSGMAARGH